MTPGAGPFFGPGVFLNKLGRGLVSDATYQISRIYALLDSDKKNFPRFPYINQCKIFDPRGGASFGPKDKILNKIGRGILNNAIYQISRL